MSRNKWTRECVVHRGSTRSNLCSHQSWFAIGQTSQHFAGSNSPDSRFNLSSQKSSMPNAAKATPTAQRTLFAHNSTMVLNWRKLMTFHCMVWRYTRHRCSHGLHDFTTKCQSQISYNNRLPTRPFAYFSSLHRRRTNNKKRCLWFRPFSQQDRWSVQLQSAQCGSAASDTR